MRCWSPGRASGHPEEASLEGGWSLAEAEADQGETVEHRSVRNQNPGPTTLTQGVDQPPEVGLVGGNRYRGTEVVDVERHRCQRRAQGQGSGQLVTKGGSGGLAADPEVVVDRGAGQAAGVEGGGPSVAEAVDVGPGTDRLARTQGNVRHRRPRATHLQVLAGNRGNTPAARAAGGQQDGDEDGEAGADHGAPPRASWAGRRAAWRTGRAPASTERAQQPARPSRMIEPGTPPRSTPWRPCASR